MSTFSYKSDTVPGSSYNMYIWKCVFDSDENVCLGSAWAYRQPHPLKEYVIFSGASRGIYSKELCAGMNVMSKFSLKVHVPAFRLQCFVHTALFKYIINKIGFISEGSDYLPPERAWKWTKTSKQNREVVIWTYTCMYPQAVMLGLMEDGIFPQITVN